MESLGMAHARSAVVHELDSVLRTSKRRDFLRLAALGGMGVFMPVVISACGDSTTNPTEKATFNFGSDRGVLNLMYVYSQFMFDFYGRFYNQIGRTTSDLYRMSALTSQMEQQRNVIANLITSGRVTDAALFDFSTVDFTDRTSIMVDHLQPFLDLGVAALNGMASRLTDAANLTLVAQIVSNWARSAATVRDLNDIAAGRVRNSFAGSADAQGLDPAVMPADVVATIQPYFRTTLSISGF
jgi:hypothetical protein